MSTLLQNLKDYLETEEGKKDFFDYFNEIERKEKITENQLKRLYGSGNFISFTEKVVAKYSRNEYVNRWYKRGIEPEEALYWFLYKYAQKYGRTCNKKEWKTYGNVFTSSLYYCEGFYFNQMNGQGSCVVIIAENFN